MSRAFDTIDRAKLLSVLDSVDGLNDDDRRIIRILLANTSLRVCFNGIVTKSFTTNVGTPQGDGLSPILFAIYLEAALRELLTRGPQRPSSEVKVGLPFNAIYADDVDFISLDKAFLERILREVGPIFGDSDLLVNVEKTEHGIIGHQDRDVDQAWRDIRKLGSLLGVEEDVDKRIKLATVSYNSLLALWKHPSLVSVDVRLQSYKAIVESVLLYNCSTWSLSEALAENLDCFQRKMLRRVLNGKWFDKITNEQLYKRSETTPVSLQVVHARWRLFGHTLRLGEDTPARMAMAYYFNKDHPGRKGNRTTIASVLSNEYKAATGLSIKNVKEYSSMVEYAQDRDTWRDIVDKVVTVQWQLREYREQRRAEKRVEAKHNAKSRLSHYLLVLVDEFLNVGL
jgi:hypothetical protein